MMKNNKRNQKEEERNSLILIKAPNQRSSLPEISIRNRNDDYSDTNDGMPAFTVMPVQSDHVSVKSSNRGKVEPGRLSCNVKVFNIYDYDELLNKLKEAKALQIIDEQEPSTSLISAELTPREKMIRRIKRLRDRDEGEPSPSISLSELSTPIQSDDDGVRRKKVRGPKGTKEGFRGAKKRPNGAKKRDDVEKSTYLLSSESSMSIPSDDDRDRRKKIKGSKGAKRPRSAKARHRAAQEEAKEGKEWARGAKEETKGAREGSRGARERSRGAKEGHRAAKERHRGAKERHRGPKERPRGAKKRPRGAKEGPRGATEGAMGMTQRDYREPSASLLSSESSIYILSDDDIARRKKRRGPKGAKERSKGAKEGRRGAKEGPRGMREGDYNEPSVYYLLSQSSIYLPSDDDRARRNKMKGPKVGKERSKRVNERPRAGKERDTGEPSMSMLSSELTTPVTTSDDDYARGKKRREPKGGKERPNRFEERDDGSLLSSALSTPVLPSELSITGLSSEGPAPATIPRKRRHKKKYPEDKPRSPGREKSSRRTKEHSPRRKEKKRDKGRPVDGPEYFTVKAPKSATVLQVKKRFHIQIPQPRQPETWFNSHFKMDDRYNLDLVYEGPVKISPYYSANLYL